MTDSYLLDGYAIASIFAGYGQLGTADVRYYCTIEKTRNGDNRWMLCPLR